MLIGIAAGFLRLLALLLICGVATAENLVPRFESAACPFEGAEDRADVQCGYLFVRENRGLAEGRVLRLSVAVLKSSGENPKPDPLVFLSGGPGDPSVKRTIARLHSPFWSRYRQERDLIFFDQRGIGFSDPEFCPEMSFAMATATFRGLSATDRKAFIVETVAACREKMLAQGIDFAFYNSTASAQDLDDLRRALGLEQWNLFGVSYGTRLALTAMRDTPAGIRSAVIDSVMPPNFPLADSKERLIRSLDRAIEQCAANADCNSAFPTLEQDVFLALDEFEKNPMTLEMGDPSRFPEGRIVIDGNVLAWGLFAGFYERDFVRIFPLFVRESRARNEAVLTALADGLVREPDLVAGLQYAVDCNEWITRISPEMAAADGSRHPQLAVWQAYADQDAVCGAWHDQRAAESDWQAVRSEIPTLIFTGEFDPITPPAFGRLAADSLPKSTFIEVPAVGHGAVPYNECTKDIMVAFLAQPSASLDTSCVAAIAPASFTTAVYMNAGISRLARQLQQPDMIRLFGRGLVLLVLLSAVVVWPLAALLRRFRRRAAPMMAEGAKRARLLAGLTALLGIAFVVALAAVIAATAQDDPFLLGFGVPAGAGRIFLLPWLIIVGTIGVVFFAVAAWARRWWTLTGRLHYSLVASACVGLTAEILSLGLF
jgi:pimeloyl-ACP methyl ester carboxylesterase